MTDLEMIQRAKVYTDKLANGINPLDNTIIPENDIINNVKISRCLFYISDVLRQVAENGGTVNKKKTAKENFYISFEEIQRFRFSDMPITMSEIARRINKINAEKNMKKISYKHLTDWLISVKMLCVGTMPDGRITKKPTKMGNEIGITTELRRSRRDDREYSVIMYDRDAQQFLVDNIASVMEMM